MQISQIDVLVIGKKMAYVEWIVRTRRRAIIAYTILAVCCSQFVFFWFCFYPFYFLFCF